MLVIETLNSKISDFLNSVTRASACDYTVCHEKNFWWHRIRRILQKRFEPIVQEKGEEFGQTNSGPKCLKHPFFSVFRIGGKFKLRL